MSIKNYIRFGIVFIVIGAVVAFLRSLFFDETDKDLNPSPPATIDW